MASSGFGAKSSGYSKNGICDVIVLNAINQELSVGSFGKCEITMSIPTLSMMVPSVTFCGKLQLFP